MDAEAPELCLERQVVTVHVGPGDYSSRWPGAAPLKPGP